MSEYQHYDLGKFASAKDSMTSSQMMLVLSPTDNVAVAVKDLPAGEKLLVGGQDVTVAGQVPLGHKVALRNIRGGEKIIKYGAPIGSATRDIAAGEHVHTHNIKSDYLPTFTFEPGKRFV